MAVTVYKETDTPRIRGVLFDMDGLVLDSEKLFCRFWAQAAQMLGFPMTMEQALGMRGLGTVMGEKKLKGWFGASADYHAIRAKRIELMDAFVAENGIDTKPGIHELLDYLNSRDIRTAITSSSPPERIRAYLSVHGLDTRFDALCSGHEVKRGKPAPDIYLHGAQVLDLRPEECLALEDAPAGIESAYRAGCVTVMVPDLDQPDACTEAMLHAKVDSLLDVINFLKKSNPN